MNLGWLRSILYGLVSGITEFLPISGQAHRILLLQFFGYGEETGLLALMVHLGLMAALLLCMGERLRGVLRERAILQMPMRRRHRMRQPCGLRRPHRRDIPDIRLLQQRVHRPHDRALYKCQKSR